MPERFTPPSGDAYSVGGQPPTKDMGLALSSVVVTPAALLPERFLGGCAFGGGANSTLSRGDLSTWPSDRASRRNQTLKASALSLCRASMAALSQGWGWF